MQAFFLFFLIVFIQTALALPVRPNKCPEMNNVEENIFIDVRGGKYDIWELTTATKTYGTNTKWNVRVLAVAKNREEAIEKAKALLKSPLEGPYMVKTAWNCWNIPLVGENTDPNQIVASSPPLVINPKA